MKTTSAILAAAGLYLGWRWWSSRPAPAPAPDRLSPILAPETVTSRAIDAATQFATHDLVAFVGGKATY